MELYLTRVEANKKYLPIIVALDQLPLKPNNNIKQNHTILAQWKYKGITLKMLNPSYKYRPHFDFGTLYIPTAWPLPLSCMSTSQIILANCSLCSSQSNTRKMEHQKTWLNCKIDKTRIKKTVSFLLWNRMHGCNCLLRMTQDTEAVGVRDHPYSSDKGLASKLPSKGKRSITFLCFVFSSPYFTL